MLAVSILGIKENTKENIKKLDNLNIDFFHIDIMDGKFVKNKTWEYEEIDKLIKTTKHKKDIHLMVNDIKKYVDEFSKMNPEIITFHYEATNNPLEIINYIKNKEIKVGISIKPETKIEKIEKYLDQVDLVLVMSVEPGAGGQKFMDEATSKIDKLYKKRKEKKLNYLIEVDGGINNETKLKVQNADILVVGSYITNNKYEEKINEFKM